MNRQGLIVALVVCFVALAGVVVVSAQGPRPNGPQSTLGAAFSYQGELKKSGAPVNDTCSMTFSLWDSPGNLSGQIGNNQLLNTVPITNGIFTVLLNSGNEFGPNAFTGDARWLQAAVKCPSDGSPVTLSREALTAAPYALSLRPGAVISGSVAGGAVLSVTNGIATFGGIVGLFGRQGAGSGHVNQQAGVWGDAANGSGVVGTSAGNGYGVDGVNSGNIGVHGAGYPAGMRGEGSGFGVWGVGGIAGVYGESGDGPGLSGYSTTGNGVFGTSFITGVSGISTGAGPGYGVYGQTAQASGIDLLESAGVWGDSRTGIGVAGITVSNTGVYGSAASSNGVGVWAAGSGPTGTALKISNGAIKVPGAGIGTSTVVFIHRAISTTIAGGSSQQTIIDHPLTNGDPNAILIVTPNYNPGNAFSAYNNRAVGVFYDSGRNKWGIFNLDLSAMTVNATFNVMVIKP